MVRITRRLRVGIVPLVALLGLGATAVLAGQVGAATKSRVIAGTFDFQAGPSATCPAPTCATALFRGSVRGPAEGESTAIFPAQPPTNLVAEGLLTVHATEGDLDLAGTVVFNPDPAGDGEVTFNFRIVGGSGAYAGASGYIIAAGLADVPGAVVANMRYTGRLTLP